MDGNAGLAHTMYENAWHAPLANNTYALPSLSLSTTACKQFVYSLISRIPYIMELMMQLME